MSDILVIDGCSLSATSFFGTLPANYHSIDVHNKEQVDKVLKNYPQSSNGVYLNAVHLFFNVLGKAIRFKDFKHVIITWDVTRDTFRRDIYPEYKANRNKPDPQLISQEALIREILEYSNIKSIYSESYEADDLIGTIANKFKDDHNIYIMSKDQDLLQVVDKNVYLWLKTNKSLEMFKERNISQEICLPGYYEFNEAEIKYFYNLDFPEYIIDLKGLIGDAGDNIPGIKGIGAKTAVPLINEFGTLEKIYEYIESVDKEEFTKKSKSLKIHRSPYNNLLHNKDIVFMSKDLARIRTNVEDIVDYNINDLELNINVKKFKEKCKELNIDFS